MIAEVYLAATNTRRARRALARLFEGQVGKDVVSRFAGSQDGRGGRPEREGRKTRSAWQAWQERDLAGEDVVRLILDGTVVRVRLDRKATSFSLLIALGVRRDAQKVVLAIKNMGGESEAAWLAVLDDLAGRGLAKPDRAWKGFWPTPWPGLRRSRPTTGEATPASITHQGCRFAPGGATAGDWAQAT